MSEPTNSQPAGAKPVHAAVQGSGNGRSETRVVTLPGVEHAQLQQPDAAHGHFRALGMDRQNCFFITARGRQLLEIPVGKLSSKATLFQLAPFSWWEREFAGRNGFSGVAVDRAVDWLLSCCYEAGVFRAEQLRGRGAWWDDGRLVVHAGDRLIVDGVETGLSELTSRWVYEAATPIAVSVDDPLPASEAQKLHQFCKLLAWEQGDIEATLFAGWVACAIACGALQWRPHGFLTGPSGGGKSTLLDAVLELLGDFVLAGKGDTSAPGLRQSLGADVLPVIVDEQEAEDQHSTDAVNKILTMMRSSSSEMRGRVLKGGQGGTPTAYALRSMFLLCAVRVPIKQTADERRITVFSLRRPTAAERARYLTEVLPLRAEITDAVFARRFRARVLARLGVLRTNTAVFAAAAGAHLGNQGLGDQLGPLLAGAYLLYSDDAVGVEAATRWVARQPWQDQRAQLDEGDEGRLLTALLEYPVSFGVDRARMDASLGELVEYASGRSYHRAIAADDAAAVLARHGLLVERERLLVSNSHREIGRALAGTPWGTGWSRILARIEGAGPSKERPYFAGARSRAVEIPLDAITGVPGAPGGRGGGAVAGGVGGSARAAAQVPDSVGNTGPPVDEGPPW